MDDKNRCNECGAKVKGGTEGCHAVYEEFLARDYSNPDFFRFHRMLVDTYSLQHPERYCKSAKSLAAHLSGLCWLLCKGTTRATGSELMQKWLSTNPTLYGDAIEHWAQETWKAYSELHPTAYGWIEKMEAEI